MPSSEKMQRVRRNSPCPVCGKPDWCLIAPDKSISICARIERGSVKKCGDAGWLHVLHEDVDRPRAFTTRITTKIDDAKDFRPLATKYQEQLTAGKISTLAPTLGVSAASLRRLQVGWDGEAYTFSMSDGKGKIIGIRRRFPSGRKASVIGSKNGLFIPPGLDSGIPLLVCEGPTDTAAAITLGFDVVGRPNCNSLVAMTAMVCRGRDVVIVADNDPKPNGSNPGLEGAMKLAERLVFACPSVKVILPPAEYKDLRSWYLAGLIRDGLLTEIEKMEPITLELV